ncbi:MAG TPA: helix-turn-helix domain-containing protein [Thermoleophilia bacterium]|nr:helix-turn-helix domain-containing protein [Thermoleophilia bacterium]
MEDRLLTRVEVAQKLGISLASVRRYVKAGYLEPWPTPLRVVRFRASDVYDLIEGDGCDGPSLDDVERIACQWPGPATSDPRPYAAAWGRREASDA